MEELASSYLNDGYDVVYDATNLIPEFRKKMLEKLPSCEKVAVCFDVPWSVCFDRNMQRKHPVPSNVMVDKYYDAHPVASMDEGWDHVIIKQYSAWTPISDPPKEEGWYLVSVQSLNDTESSMVQVAKYVGGSFAHISPMYRVTAWQDIPEAYNEDDEV